MTHPVLHGCPVCHDQLQVAALRCPSCATEVRGDFAAPGADPAVDPAGPGLGGALDQGQQQLVRQLVAARGDLVLVAREQRCDRNQLLRDLDGLAAALGVGRLEGAPEAGSPHPSAPNTPDGADHGARPSRDEVLAAVAQGRMDPDEAARLLRG